MKNKAVLELSNHPSSGCNFFAVISENCIPIAGDNLPMHNINTMTLDYRANAHSPVQPKGIQFLLWRQMVGSALMKIKVNPEANKNLNGN